MKRKIWGDNISIPIGSTKLLAPSCGITSIIENVGNGPLKSGSLLLTVDLLGHRLILLRLPEVLGLNLAMDLWSLAQVSDHL
jgi:hypothetical protein